MRKFAQTCRFLADGRRVDESWRQLLNSEFVLAACQSEVNRRDTAELEQAYKLLACDSANRNAVAAHQRLFKLPTGKTRLEIIRRAVACARLAICCRESLSQKVLRGIEEWTPRTVGKEGSTKWPELTVQNTPESIISAFEQALGRLAQLDDEGRWFAISATKQFAGLAVSPIYSVKMPIALIDSLTGSGKIAWLHLQKLEGGGGGCFGLPVSQLGLELSTDTKQGVQIAWQYACSGHTDANFDVAWWLEGADSLSGRSADAAFAVGFRSLFREIPFDSHCIISAEMSNDGRLAPVNGIQDAGNIKLQAARTLQDGSTAVQVFVARENSLRADEQNRWMDRGVIVNACDHIDEVFDQTSQELRTLNEFLEKQIASILSQASSRFERPLQSLEDFSKLIVPMRVARGVRSTLSDDEQESLGHPLSNNQDEISDETSQDGGTVTRQVLDWKDFIVACGGRTIVLGDPGFGKTTLLWQLVAETCSQAASLLRSENATISQLTIAVYLPAAKLAETLAQSDNQSSSSIVLDCIESYCDTDGLLRTLLEEKLLNGQCLVCLDALDEVSDARDLERFLSVFLREHSAVRIVVTSRLTGYAGPPFEMELSNQAELLPFTNSQIRQAIEAWFGNDQELASVVRRQVLRNEQLNDVFRSPILLHLASQQVLSALRAKRPLPTWDRRTELYEGFVALALSQLAKRTDEPIKEMEQFEFRLFLGELAYRLWLKDPRRSLWPREILHTEIKFTVDAGKHWGLQKRFHQLFDDLQDSGVMVPVAAGDHRSPMMFLHRTIAEYLAGHHLANAINNSRSECWQVVEKKCWDSAWQQVLLFCCGSLKEPEAMLLRLENGTPSVDNPRGDDLLRHRLMLAAQCLLECNPADVGSCRARITHEVIQAVKRIPGIINLPPGVDAIRSLLSLTSDSPSSDFRRELQSKLPSIENVLQKIGAAAYSDELFEWLSEQLWDACGTDSPRTNGIRRSPQPFANAIVAICDVLDVDQVIQGNRSNDEAKWRVIGSLFRAAAYQSSKSVKLTATFLDAIGTAVVDSNQVQSVGLSQTIEYLPQIDYATLEQSGLIRVCCSTLEKSDSEEVSKRVFRLLESLGEVAATDKQLAGLVAGLSYDVPSRTVVKTILAMKSTLAAPEFLWSLSSAIDTADEKHARLGMEIFFALHEKGGVAWQKSAEYLIGRYEFAGRLLETWIKEDSSNSLVSLTNTLLSSEEHRPLALRATKNFVTSFDKLEPQQRGFLVAQRTEWLDGLIASILKTQGKARFDQPEILDSIRDSTDLSIRILYKPLVGLACRYRPTEALADWIVGALAKANDGIDESLLNISEEFPRLSKEIKKYLFYSIKEAGLMQKSRGYLNLARTILSDPRDLLNYVVHCSGETQQDVAALTILAELPSQSIDERLVDTLLNHLNSRKPVLRRLASRACRNLDDSALTPVVAGRLLDALKRESVLGELTMTIIDLASRSPDYFAGAILELYFDAENLLHEQAAAILPSIGNRFIDSNRFSDASDRVHSQDRGHRAEAIHLLCKLLSNCDGERRRRVLAVLAEVDDDSIFSRLNPFDPSNEELVMWLISELLDQDPKIANGALRLLLQRCISPDGKNLDVLVSRIQLPMGFVIRIRQPAQSHDPTFLKRMEQMALACQSRGVRFFGCDADFLEGINGIDLAG